MLNLTDIYGTLHEKLQNGHFPEYIKKLPESLYYDLIK